MIPWLATGSVLLITSLSSVNLRVILTLVHSCFLKCATSSPSHHGNTVKVLFTDDVHSPAFSFGSCANQITLSQLLVSEADFTVGL